jgi:hypothetical protein
MDFPRFRALRAEIKMLLGQKSGWTAFATRTDYDSDQGAAKSVAVKM